jgi:hypothetical protein
MLGVNVVSNSLGHYFERIEALLAVARSQND